MNKIYTSQDGSDTIMSDRFNVLYHSKYGAIDESKTVFIDAGLNDKRLIEQNEINIFEMGFGTGLNPLLSLIEADAKIKKITYTGIEAYPISNTIAAQLNYSKKLNPSYHTPFLKMHSNSVDSNIYNLKLSPYFNFNKIIGKIEDTDIGSNYNLIYYDAFAPESQPELWQELILTKLFNALSTEGILVTYCAKGAFKRALKSIGFTVESLPGPTGKREITRAIKQNKNGI